MTTQYEEPMPTAREPASSTHDDFAPPDLPSGKRARWLWVVAVLGAFALIVAGGVWWLIDSTVPQQDYDDAVEELEAARADVEQAEGDLAQSEQVREDLEATLRSSGDEVTSQRSEILAYQEGAVAVWTGSMLAAGFELDVASCVAEAMVQDAGPATLGVFTEFAIGGGDMLPSGEFMGTLLDAMDECGVPMDSLVGLGEAAPDE